MCFSSFVVSRLRRFRQGKFLQEERALSAVGVNAEIDVHEVDSVRMSRASSLRSADEADAADLTQDASLVPVADTPGVRLRTLQGWLRRRHLFHHRCHLGWTRRRTMLSTKLKKESSVSVGRMAGRSGFGAKIGRRGRRSISASPISRNPERSAVREFGIRRPSRGMVLVTSAGSFPAADRLGRGD